jgi:hypothetical protein
MSVPPEPSGPDDRGMTPTRPQIAAAALLTINGLLAGTTALAIAIAGQAVAAGIPVQPGDALLLADLLAVLPFIVAFVTINLATASGLATGRAWAIAAGSVLSLGSVAMGTLGLLLLVLGGDPATLTGTSHAAQADGLGLVGLFTGLNLAVLLALRVDERPNRQPRRPTAIA